MSTFKRDQNMFNNDGPSFCKTRTEPLEVLMVGLSRTGTTSMLEAMKTLGYGDIYSSRDMIRRHQGIFCTKLLEAKYSGQGPQASTETFESLFGEYRCISGEFVSMMAEELIAAYPEAKVILTIRDDEQRWLRSLLDSMWYNYSTWTAWFLRNFDRNWANNGQFTRVLWREFYWGDPNVHGLRVYREHNAMVKRVVQPQDRLLVFSVTQGWGPLCSFLGKEVPGVEFPATNTVEDHRVMFSAARRKYLKAWVSRMMVNIVVPSVVVGAMVMKRGQIVGLMKQLRGR